MSEEEKIKEFDREQLKLLINKLKDINNFTGFHDGAFKYYLGKYEADILLNCIEELQQRIDEAIEVVEFLDKTFIQEEHLGSAKDEDCMYNQLLKILKGDNND